MVCRLHQKTNLKYHPFSINWIVKPRILPLKIRTRKKLRIFQEKHFEKSDNKCVHQMFCLLNSRLCTQPKLSCKELLFIIQKFLSIDYF